MTADDAGWRQMVAARIQRQGWLIQGVLPAADDPRPTLPFFYTCGLYRPHHGLHPELVIAAAINSQVAAGLLNRLAKDVTDTRLTAGDRVPIGVSRQGRAYTAVLWAVPDSTAEPFPLNIANTVLPDGPVPALQVVLPDRWHRYPWDDGYDFVRLPQAVIGARTDD